NILPKNIFIRISSSEIVNLNQVKQFDLTAAGMFKVMFKNGNSTFASKRYIKKIQEALSR
ncbi:MAG TPA: LytTR family transcriptional regulator, partial [Lactobacillus acetotolerans]|nr:LytTR family transcriptional regulator [Lactobacillus acetotolerans]